MKIRIAARGSRLSLEQVKVVENFLSENGYETEFLEIKTKADLFNNRPLTEIGKGVFEKEVNEAILQGKADIAVHSMKDLSSELPAGLEIIATPKREEPIDVLIANTDLMDLPSGSKIGTSSVRRAYFLKAIRPDVVVSDIRGNVDTRLKKYLEGTYTGLILAEAGLRRLGINIERYPLNVRDFTPEPNQGIIAVVSSSKNTNVKEALKGLNHEDTMAEAIAERITVSLIGGGCHTPLGVLFRKIDNKLEGIASYSNGIRKVTVDISTSDDPKEAGRKLGESLLRGMKNEGIVLKT
ncbi:hydroxymethylbilane synthase [Metallosphaera tengchongensis]|uniref:Probable porphobilinogen deaminase n=1 Tax=Metallosphaera tengchongensis TaxID=1532350 RepID=A0A6N0NTF2_9CREN|nr:hydroxymethylbilane synthase [Metallosphaera tengchongensis]QKQ99971.1 hydroxymethylbilane synthase [Metallosphaera tengchongensis]